MKKLKQLLILLSVLFFYDAKSQSFPGQIGVGLGGLGSVGLSAVYPDVAPTANWKSPDFAGNPVTVDANGWPTQNFDLTVFDARPFNAWNYPGQPTDDPQGIVTPTIFGSYIFSWNGSASITNFSDNGSMSINGPVYNATSNMSTMTVNWNTATCGGGWNCSFFYLRFTNTKATNASATNTGIKNLKIIRPGFNPTTTQLFNNTFVNAISPFSTMRFMDWTGTNGNPEVNWTDRQLTTNYPYNRAPWEHVIALANLTGKDIWINIPAQATDAYVQSLANMFKDNLRTDINVYIEYSNEVWNGMFAQEAYNTNLAVNGAADADVRAYATANLCACNNIYRVLRVAKRIVRIGQIFSTTLGVNINPTSRIRPVLAWQIGGFRQEYQYALQYIKDTYATPNSKNTNNYIYGIAGAPYFNDGGAATNATPAQVVTAMIANSDGNVPGVVELAQYASTYGVRNLQYEGGPDIGGGNATNIQNRVLANRIPQMQTAINRNYARNWFSTTATGTAPVTVNGLANYFVMDGGNPSRYGAWGSSEDLSQLYNTSVSGKYQALCSLTGICGTAPLVAITSPTANSTQSGTFTISTNTTVTSLPISTVEFFVNGLLIGSDNSSPYSINWTPTTIGINTLYARVVDNVGRFYLAPAVTIYTTTAASSLNVSPTSYNYASSGSSQLFTVTSNVSWTATSSQSWLTLSSNTGTNNGAFNATANINTAVGARFAVISLTGGSLSQIINITQAGALPGGTVFYISPTGNDANSGLSPATAWQTATQVKNYAWTTGFNPGDKILFQGNTTITGDLYFERNRPVAGKNVGLPNNLISIGTYGGGMATINSGNSSGIYMYNTAGYSIAGIKFSGTAKGVNNNAGMSFYADANQLFSTLIINNVEAYGYDSGLSLGEWCASTPYLGFTNVSIIGSRFYDNLEGGVGSYGRSKSSHTNLYMRDVYTYRNYGDPVKTANSGSGIVVSGFDGGLVEYCTAYDNGKDNIASSGGPVGIWAYEAKNITFQYCESYANKSLGLDGGGFDLDGGTENCIIQYCYSHDNYGPGFLYAQYGGATTMQNDIMRYNVSVNDGRQGSKSAVYFWGGSTFSNCHFYNNTIYADNSTGKVNGTGGIVYLNGTNYSGIKVRNNIFYVTGGATLINTNGANPATSVIHFQDNAYYAADGNYQYLWGGATYTSLSAWKAAATGQEMDGGNSLGFQGNPLLVNPGQTITFNNPFAIATSLTGYRLQITSPLIGAGSDLRTAPFGSQTIGGFDFYGNTIPQGNAFDVGAHEYQSFLTIPGISSLNFSAAGGNFTITILSNLNWNVLGTNSWLTVNTLSGSNSGSLSITASANASVTGRNATLTITGGGITQFITVNQAGAAGSNLTVNTNLLYYSYRVATQPISVTSNVSWSATSSQPWLSFTGGSGTNNGTFNVVSSLHTIAGLRTAQISVTGGGFTRIINITQTGILPLKIACLGNSITQGNVVGGVVNQWSYRFFLWEKLDSLSMNIDMVGFIPYWFNETSGTMVTTPLSRYTARTFDRDHDAYYGITSSSHLKGDPSTGWTGSPLPSLANRSYFPDFALLHIGTNDNDSEVTTTVSNINATIDEMRKRNPNVVVLLAKLITSWKPINAKVDSIVLAKSTAQSPVVMVDMPPGFINDPAAPGTMTFDWVHPNTVGSVFMAKRWFDPLIQYINDPIFPSSPATISATNLTTSTSRINWASASDNYGIKGYRIFINGSYVTSLSGTAYTVTGLTQGVNYPVTVVAVDFANNLSGPAVTNIFIPVSSFLTANPLIINYPSGGNSQNISITSNVSWTSTSSQPWLTLTGGSGTNNGTISATAAANTATGIRTAQVTVSGGALTQIINITQSGAAASLTANPTTLTYASAGSSQNIGITSNVSWTSSSSQPWLTLTGGSGTNDGTISATASTNTATGIRTAQVTVTGGALTQIINITQSGAAASLTANPTTLTYASTSSTQAISITSNVSWTSTSSQPWLTLTGGSGTNNGTISATASANTATGIRTAQVTVTGGALTQIINITQSGAAASLTANPTTLNYASTSSTQAISITSNVSWTSTSSQPWLTLTGGSGTNNGTISANASANTATGIRTAQVTITGGALTQFINITQSGASFAIGNKYYVNDVSGSDANDGISQATPWKSVAKVNAMMSLFSPGDSILFKRNGVFRGQLTISKSGDNTGKINFGAYGLGDLPVLSGATSLSGWIALGGNIFETTCSGCGSVVNGVFIEGVPQTLGRTPNFNTTNKGYLTIAAHSGTTQLTAVSLPDANDYTGGQLVSRSVRWVLDEYQIISQVGNVFNLASSNYYQLTDNTGFFIQNHPATLDSEGEWYYNPINKTIRVYHTGTPIASLKIEASVSDYNVLLNNHTNLSFTNIQFSNANQEAVYGTNNQHIDFIGTQVLNTALNGIRLISGDQISIINSSVVGTPNNGVTLICNNVLFKNNLIKRNALKEGMGNGQDGQYNALVVEGDGIEVGYNRIDSIGYLPVDYRGDNINVHHNYITNYVMTKDDGGAIYTWSAGSPVNVNRTVADNIILNAIGVPEGSGDPGHKAAEGIYIDDRSSGVQVLRNTVYNCGNNGIFLHNANNIVVKDNLVYNNENQFLIAHDNLAPTFPIRNVDVQNNIFFSKTPTQGLGSYRTIGNDISQFGVMNNNYFCRPFNQSLEINSFDTQPLDRGLAEWRTAFGYELNSKQSPVVLNYYIVNTLIGPNILMNSTLDANINPWYYCWANNGNCQIDWQINGGLDGGCMRAFFTSITSATGAMMLFPQSIGSISNTKKYILRFSAISNTSVSEILKVSLREDGGAFTYLSAPVEVTYNNVRKEYEILFEPTVSISNVRLEFELSERTSTLWLDNLQLFEADIAISNPDNYLFFDYNPTSMSKTVPLAGTYISPDNATITGSITIPPYSSRILIKAQNVTTSGFINVSTLTAFLSTPNSQLLTISSNVNWTITGIPSWLTTSSTNGTNNGTINFTASNNTSTGIRIATITIQSFSPSIIQTLNITQSGAAVSLTANPTTLTYASTSSTQAISITSNVSWTSISSQPWLTLTGGSGTNNGTISATAAANTATGIRTAQVTVTGGALTQIINITQSGAAASLTANPTTLTYASAGSTQAISITSNVSWTSTSSQPWLTLTGGSGTNNGTISATAAANTATGIRTAQVTVTGGALTQIINITQSGAAVSLTANSTTLTYASASSTQAISITSNVSWTSTSSQPWLTLAGGSGTNNGTISATASTNTATGIRTAQVTVTGGALTQIINITQSGAAASLTANPTTLTYASAGSSQNIGITSNVSWTSSSSQPWLTLTGGSG
ncbi:MAG: BACON domain-containing carbohydrate-binding protein, partial [Bacteroidota bacterium]|nr:BACON domain-containing carbohydrate-binding protein [Bacteroidota bacterium]